MSFQQFGLHPDLLKAIRQVGYQTPTPVQQQAIPHAVSGRDLIGCAQTGTGKTAAFALPILNKLHNGSRSKTRALILTPTRELAAQINEVFRNLAKYTPVRTTSIYGGVNFQPQEKALRTGVDVIVATPGRLLDHIRQGMGRFGALEFFVLDEADRMLDMGFLPDVKRIIARLPQERQTMMFSATMPPAIYKFSREILHQPAKVKIGPSTVPVERITQAAYPVAQNLKTQLLVQLLRETEMDSVLVFARTKMRTKRLARHLEQRGFAAVPIHGDRTQAQRNAALSGFRNRRYQILVATDVASRGLDVTGISHVINFDVPATAEDYVHRIGRTARGQAIGEALTLVSPAEASSFSAIQRATKSDIRRQTVPDFDYGKESSDLPVASNRRKKRHYSSKFSSRGRRRI